MADESTPTEAPARPLARRIVMYAVGALAVLVGAGAGWLLTRPPPCDRLAKALCSKDDPTPCEGLGAKFVKMGVTQDECAATHDRLRETLASTPVAEKEKVRNKMVMEMVRGHLDLAPK